MPGSGIIFHCWVLECALTPTTQFRLLRVSDPNDRTPTLRRAAYLSLLGSVAGQHGKGAFHICAAVNNKPGAHKLGGWQSTGLFHMGSVRVQSHALSDEVSGMAMVENRAGSATPYDSITRKTHVWQLGECVSSKEIIKVRGKRRHICLLQLFTYNICSIIVICLFSCFVTRNFHLISKE